jgi:hypothetical protein
MGGMLVAYSSPSEGAAATPTSSGISCGQATAVTNDPSDPGRRGVRIGEIFFVTARDASGRAEIANVDPHSPTKVLIQPIQPLTSALRIEGWRCSTGERLRLQFGDGPPTVAAALLPAGSPANGTTIDYTGYMFFTASGEWMISVGSKTGHQIGRAVFTVRAR